mmetsp:Transcript_20318/g.31103  ORF Transcript_20318/g.31103 Transcript_20318/m.31103 type:complete len:438 (+) Transcript_20318:79-1392(+)
MSNNTNQNSNFLVVGLNPAFQKRLLLSKNASNQHSNNLIPGNVHRIDQVLEGIGGKGQDVAVSLSILGICPDLLQFVGAGDGNGDHLMQLLREKLTIDDGKEKNHHHETTKSNYDPGRLTIRTKSKLRTCTTIVGSDNATELVEPSGLVEPNELQELTQLIDSVQNINALCIMGSMPPGCPEDTYAQIIASVMRDNSNALCVIDSVVGLKFMLNQLAALEGARDRAVLKVNVSELCKLASLKSDDSKGDTPTSNNKRDMISAAVDGFVKAFGGMEHVARAIQCILLTDGKDPGYVVQLKLVEDDVDGTLRPYQIYQMDAIDLSNHADILFPIGAGDAVAAGTLAAWDYIRRVEQGPLHDKESSHEVAASDVMLHKDVQQCLSLRRRDFGMKTTDDQISDIVRAFAFGIACGSASCLVEENSEFRLADVLRLFREMMR